MQKSPVAKPASAAPESASEPTKPLTKSETKVVRETFKMPRRDFDLISALKARAAGLNHPTKKGELLRAGLISLTKLSDADLTRVLDALVPLKVRPSKEDVIGTKRRHLRQVIAESAPTPS